MATENETQEESSAVGTECSVPIVHLTSNILETESLSSLTEDTYVDSLLITLPVSFTFFFSIFISILTFDNC